MHSISLLENSPSFIISIYFLKYTDKHDRGLNLSPPIFQFWALTLRHWWSPSVWRTVREYDMHPFHVQRVQTLQSDDYAPRIAFAQWYLGKFTTDSFSLLKRCFPIRHPSQGKEFSTRIKPICEQRRNYMQYDFSQQRLDFRSMFGPLL